MKYIIFLLLASSFIACKPESRSKSRNGTVGNADGPGVTTVWNNTTINLRVKKAGVEVLKLKKGECVNLSSAEVDVLTIEEDDYGIGLDDIICSNMDADETPCSKGSKAVVEAEDKNGWILKDFESNSGCSQDMHADRSS